MIVIVSLPNMAKMEIAAMSDAGRHARVRLLLPDEADVLALIENDDHAEMLLGQGNRIDGRPGRA
jgi:hypothetical protein